MVVHGIVKIVDMKNVMERYKECKPIMYSDSQIFLWHKDKSGFELCIDDVCIIPYHDLYSAGEAIGISEPELSFFLKRNLVSTNEAIELLDCSRQNLDELVKRGKLHPIIDQNRIRLYKKSELMTYAKRK